MGRVSEGEAWRSFAQLKAPSMAYRPSVALDPEPCTFLWCAQTAATTQTVANAVSGATKTMTAMQQQMDPQKINKTMQQFAKENAKMGGCCCLRSMGRLAVALAGNRKGRTQPQPTPEH